MNRDRTDWIVDLQRALDEQRGPDDEHTGHETDDHGGDSRDERAWSG